MVDSDIEVIGRPVDIEAEVISDDKKTGKVMLEIEKSEISFSGPLPHPDIMKGYDDIVPGAAERILKMAENQQNHRFKLEEKIVFDDSSERKRNSYFAFTLILVVILLGGSLLFKGKSIVGLATVFAGLAPLIGIFFRNYKDNKPAEKELKQQEIDENNE
ncbi:MAG: DUF2335 domain-containing protein [Peptostreptococcus porci]|uniref:DUF2335 domain-containing protein n=1 Tax=Peptostreptococcus porci TaxID=2652282 RepID=UPI002A756C08|nr:DUF2335 domain-containing protein [Peptostreptococcus porci]MDY2793972.1 DUF2335 domain-containing protein [Peptostreptococcus porci]MDY5480188.1 DUF2335 domain-containing protein [Peptostreptococcus porci]